MKAIAVFVALLGVAAAAPAPSLSATRPTGTGAPAHHDHGRPGPPFPAFQGGHHSFSGARPSFTGVRPSGEPRPTDLPPHSIAARQVSSRPPRPTGDHSFTHDGTRPAHTGAPHSFTGSGEHPKPTHSFVRGDQRPGGWPKPSHGGPHSFSGVRPSFTRSHSAPSQSA